MNKPKLYTEGNSVQRCEVEKFLKEFIHRIEWRSTGGDRILDVGCGSGDVTREILLPILPANFERVIGIDVSIEMIEYARKTQIHPKLSFEQFDLNVELEKQNLHLECVDHIFSFNCLHWVRNLRIGFRNLHKLLKPGGDMLVLFSLSNPIFENYKELAENSPWSGYLSDLEKKLPRTDITSDQLQAILSECGFTKCDIQIHDTVTDKMVNGIDGLRSEK